MEIIEATRILGEAIQSDERFIAYAKAKLENDNDEGLQKNIGEFNVIRMNLDKELSSENKNEDKIKEYNEQLRKIYSEIMTSKSMLNYNTAKAGVDAILSDINSMISQFMEGADPKTTEPETACTGSCSTCGGCH